MGGTAGWNSFDDAAAVAAPPATAVQTAGVAASYDAATKHDKKTPARYVHGLLRDRIGLDDFDLVAHDLGAGVGAQYVAQFPREVNRYVHMDHPLPGGALPAARYRTFSWHMAFNSQGDMRACLTAFSTQVAYGGSAFGGTRTRPAFTGAETDEYVRTDGRPDARHAAFELHRTLDEDERDNTAVTPVATPTPFLTATGSLAATRPTLAPMLRRVVRAVEIPEPGHWLAEDNPAAVAREILSFTAE
ncbi:alpha/beta hydrolase [Streptomyces sp. NPDC048518]|uniref:alpha/beta fold hydrolase n=1 Tax=Streptomyces sp. NPDC048518 TaxID=3155029 RepID=UPI0033F99438